MKRWLWSAAALAVVTVACSVEPLDDPGLGNRGLSTIVYASDGSVLATWHAEEDRTLVNFDELPRSLLDAVVAIEDERFWIHPGVDLRAVARALFANVEAGSIVEGGSTITQQYLKNVLLTPEVTVDRKVEEASLALRLEEGLTKEQILERYLNTVYFGHGAYGVGTAAMLYFGKQPRDLTLAQSALLAGLIQAPASSDPYIDPERALERRRVVLERMVSLGWLDAATAATADAEELVLSPPVDDTRERYPYFTEAVKRLLLSDPALGATPTDRYNALFRGGLRINTTVDPLVQESAQAAIGSVLPAEGPAAALAAIDPRTGHVLALVGGRDFYDSDDPIAQFNLATQGHRQPGSAFKPFVLAAALENGFSLDSMFQGGSRVTVQTDSGPWTVDNYDGAVFPNLTLAEATVFSVNVIYAQLVEAVGAAKVVDLAKAAGITSDLKPFDSIALGAQEVTPLDMASAYGTFAADGVHVDPILVTTIETHAGINIYSATPAVSQVLDRAVAQQVTAVLGEVVRRGTGQQARIGRPIAGKTGTSQEHRDAWFIGYTPEMVASVWVGFPQGQVPMEYPATPFPITGGTWPAQIWARFASGSLSGIPYGQLAAVSSIGLITVEIDTSTGFVAGPLCPRQHVQRLQLPQDQAPTVICPIHNPQGITEIGAGQVPNVIGFALDEAMAALTQHGFQVTVTWDEPGPLAPGTIYGQNPSGGMPALSGVPIRLTVAGPEPGSVVPGLLGHSAADAEVEVGAIGVALRVILEAESDPTAARARSGLVWKQDPGAGAPPRAVTVWVNP